MAAGPFEYLDVKYFALDPLFSGHIKISLKDALELKEYPKHPGVYAIVNHPVSTVHVMGDVVMVDHRRHFTSYSIDDGTGCITCVRWYNKDPVPSIRLGQLVSVFGKLDDYKGLRQIRVYQIFVENDPNAEIFHMAAILRLKSTVYCTPFCMPKDLVRYQEGITRQDTDNNCEESVSSVLKKWLATTMPVHFSMDSLCQEDSLMKEVNGVCRHDKVMEYLKKSLQSLLREDHLVVDHLENGDVVFKYVDYERDLKPAIVNFISSRGSADINGVDCEVILRGLSQFPRRRVLESLQLLLQSSDIFECQKNSYKAVQV